MGCLFIRCGRFAIHIGCECAVFIAIDSSLTWIDSMHRLLIKLSLARKTMSQ